MNRRSLMLPVTAALLTFLDIEGVAAGAAKIPFTHASSGTIAFIDNNKLVVTHQKDGKRETLSFVLSRETSRKGDLSIGVVVSVHYRMENNQRVATSIQEQRSEAPEHKSK